MIATLSAVTRERLRRFMRIVRMAAVIGVGVGAVYGVAIAGPGARALLVSLLISIPIGVIAALLTASCIAGIEILLLPRASMRWLDASHRRTCSRDRTASPCVARQRIALRSKRRWDASHRPNGR